MTELAPATPEELSEAVRATPRLLAVGGRTKPRLSQTSDECVKLSTRALSGLVEYDPSEFTFTALAGTPLRLISAALAERGQYLPFDPPFVDAGATLGGTVAAGLSGPGRFRYGGLRDFILGVRFVDGLGRLLRMGGKVVKNAAGFDLPKFFVGSLGRFGVLAEITFKVFPRVPSFVTVRVPYATPSEAAEMISLASSSRWELDALELSPQEHSLFLRVGGAAVAAEALATEILARYPAGAIVPADEAELFWASVREFRWAHPEGILVKVPLTPKVLPEFCRLVDSIDETRGHVTAGAATGYLSFPASIPNLHGRFSDLRLRGMTLRGDAPLWLGSHPRAQIDSAVKAALDSTGRFPSLDS